jgi:hypothetical protein
MSGIINDKGDRIVGRLALRDVSDSPAHFVANYEGQHSDNKSTLSFNVVLKLNKHTNTFTSNISISDDCGGDTAEASLKKLSRWLTRMGETLRYVEQTSVLPCELETGVSQPETAQEQDTEQDI